jgi:hypothetical protein
MAYIYPTNESDVQTWSDPSGTAQLGTAAKEVLKQSVAALNLPVANNAGLTAQSILFDKEMVANLKAQMQAQQQAEIAKHSYTYCYASDTPPTMADLTYMLKVYEKAKQENETISAGLIQMGVSLIQRSLGITIGEYASYVQGSPHFATVPPIMPTPAVAKIDTQQQQEFVSAAIQVLHDKAEQERQAAITLDKLVAEANETEERTV